MTPLDQALVARCADAWRAWQPYAAKRNGKGPPTPTVPSVDALLEHEGITWGSTRALYYRYERAVRRRVGKKVDRRRTEHREAA